MSNEPSSERQAARRRFGFSEDCLDVSTLLRARGPDGIDCDRVADLAADETGRSIEHQRAKLALLFAKAGYEAWGLTADFRLADTASARSRLGFECAGVDIVSELVDEAERLCDRFGWQPPVLTGLAREWNDPNGAKRAALEIQNWAGEQLGKLDRPTEPATSNGPASGQSPPVTLSRGDRKLASQAQPETVALPVPGQPAAAEGAMVKEASGRYQTDQPKSKGSAKAIESLLGSDGEQILTIVRSNKSVDDKMRAVCDIDKRYLSPNYRSPWWAELLGVSQAAVRKTKFWKADRSQALAALE